MKTLNYGIVGAGAISKEFYHASLRLSTIRNLNISAKLVGIIDPSQEKRAWWSNMGINSFDTIDDLLLNEGIDFIYSAPPHLQHYNVYADVIRKRIPLLGEKPFGVNLNDNVKLLELTSLYDQLVCCSTQYPFFPAMSRLLKLANEESFGDILSVELNYFQSVGFSNSHHWKNSLESNPKGGLTELGLHLLFPLIRCNLKYSRGQMINKGHILKALFIMNNPREEEVPVSLTINTISPGHQNTFEMKVLGSNKSLEFSTKNPNTLLIGNAKENSISMVDCGLDSVYRTYTPRIFNPGINDAYVQMIAAFCDQLVNKDNMIGNFKCMSVEESYMCHKIIEDLAQI